LNCELEQFIGGTYHLSPLLAQVLDGLFVSLGNRVEHRGALVLIESIGVDVELQEVAVERFIAALDCSVQKMIPVDKVGHLLLVDLSLQLLL